VELCLRIMCYALEATLVERLTSIAAKCSRESRKATITETQAIVAADANGFYFNLISTLANRGNSATNCFIFHFFFDIKDCLGQVSI
jgi:hypothetical protein